MKREELSIKNTIIGLFICLCALIVIFASSQVKAVVNPTADNITLDVQCANGRMGRGKCPSGQELPNSLIFSEDFDSQPDWMTAGKQTVGTIPAGWDSARTDEEWHPSVEVGTQPSMQINGNDPNKVYGGTGKAFIAYAESFNATDDNGWSSDGQLTKDITPSSEIYVKLNIKFQAGFGDNLATLFGSSKIFRAAYWNGTGSRYAGFSTGTIAPIYIWNWYANDYGARNQHAFRCAHQSNNYYCTNPAILNPPRQIASGDMNANFTDTVAALNPQIPDLVNGGFLPTSGTVTHNQVWGEVWHTLEFHLKMNSAAGVQDGVFQYWLDGQKLISMHQIPWIGTGDDSSKKWNVVSIGGNDHHHTDLVGDPINREYWYSIDNFEIHNALPPGKQ